MDPRQNPIGALERGFTLIELMIVVAVIGILAGIAIPGFVQGRVAANETAVVGAVRAIATGQFKFQTMGLVDTDFNGGYEFGTVSEMTGVGTLRGSGGERLSPNLLPMSIGPVDANGRFTKHGYYFQLYLPDAAGVGQPETAAGMGAVDATRAAEFWSLVAWPRKLSQDGNLSFFVNQQGEIVKTRGVYEGLGAPPPAGCALLGTPDATRIDSPVLAVNVVGADGHVWTPVR